MATLTFADTKAELDALFCAVFSGAWNTVAQNAGSPATSLYVSLHTAAPGNGGSQNTSETVYTNYARVAVPRTTAGWTTALGSGTSFSSVSNAAAINFATGGATGATLTHWGLGLSASGAGTLLAWGPLGPTAGPDVSFECTSASPGVLTCYGYAPTVNDQVMVAQIQGTQGLPTGLTEGTIYYIGTAPGGNTATLSTTASNANPVNTSSTGQGIIYKCSPLAVSNGITPSIAIGGMIIQKG
jgi:hypothetical protein